MHFKVHPKEKIYLVFMIIVSLLMPFGLLTSSPETFFLLLSYALFFALLSRICSIIMLGNLRGNAIQVSAYNFPDVYEIVLKQSRILELTRKPTVYIQHHGGILNAFATKLLGRNYIVLYSEVLEAAYQEGMSTVEFIIAHELGHIKRGHVGGMKSLLLLPAKCIPFLSNAYSRACEYTCDNIAYTLCPEGYQKGLLILCAGKNLYKKINIDEMVAQYEAQQGFSTRFAEMWSTHPHLVNRINALHDVKNIQPSSEFTQKYSVEL